MQGEQLQKLEKNQAGTEKTLAKHGKDLNRTMMRYVDLQEPEQMVEALQAKAEQQGEAKSQVGELRVDCHKTILPQVSSQGERLSSNEERLSSLYERITEVSR